MEKEERNYNEYEIDLREYIMLLWDNKWFIIGLFIIAVLGAFLLSKFYLTPTYETEATIYAPDFELVNKQKLTQNDYISFMRKNEIAKKIIDDLDLNNDRNISENDLLDNLSIEKDKESSLVSFSYKGSKAKEINDILDAWINLFNEEVINHVETENDEYISSLKENMDNKKENLDKTRDELLNFNKENNLSLMKTELKEAENKLVSTGENSENLSDNIEKNESKLTEITNQLGSTDEFLVKEEIISDSVLRKMNFLFNKYDNIEELNNITTQQEELNPNYITLEDRKNDLKQSLQEDKKELSLLENRLNDIESEIEELQIEVSNKENEEENLQEELDIVKKNYQNAEEEYSKAEQSLNSEDYQITVVNNPVIPQSPISPNTKLNVAIAGVLSLMLGVFIVFFREFLKEDENKEITT